MSIKIDLPAMITGRLVYPSRDNAGSETSVIVFFGDLEIAGLKPMIPYNVYGYENDWEIDNQPFEQYDDTDAIAIVEFTIATALSKLLGGKVVE